MKYSYCTRIRFSGGVSVLQPDAMRTHAVSHRARAILRAPFMNVHLAVLDLVWPDRETRLAADFGRLAALETLIARGRRRLAPVADLEFWLLAAWRTEGAA